MVPAEQPYPRLPSRIDIRSEDFRACYEDNRAQLERLGEALKTVSEGGGKSYQERHRERGKLLPRERIEWLLDRDSPYLEIAPLAGQGMPGEPPSCSVIGGVGLVSGVECVLLASEATVKGGAITPMSRAKTARLLEIADENEMVMVHLIESAGADLTRQDEIFVPAGATFRSLTRRSEKRLPTVCLVFGSSTAGGAYMPGMSDYAVMVDRQAQVFLAGPPLVRMATGEVASAEELGGAQMHSSVSGVSDYLARDDRDAIRLGREIVAHLNWRKAQGVRREVVEKPLYPADDLLGIASADPRQPIDVREIVARIVDGSRFSEHKPLYGKTLVCGWAHIHGYPVGVLANDGVLFSDSANKGAQFIALCNQNDIPLLFLQNITGFMVGTEVEREGIIKHGAKMINAVSNSTVPSITIMIGASYGAGNYAMAGRAYMPRFLFTWPNHRIAVMGGKQLAGVIDIVKREAAERKGQAVDEMQLAGARKLMERAIEQQSDPFYASARLWDDGIIDPRDSRTVIAMALSAAHNAPVRGTTSWGVYRH